MKRLTKAQREAAQKEALRQRVADIAAGANAGEFDDENGFACAVFLSRFLPALKERFNTENRDYLFGLHNLDEYDTIKSTTEFLWRAGIRANEEDQRRAQA